MMKEHYVTNSCPFFNFVLPESMEVLFSETPKEFNVNSPGCSEAEPEADPVVFCRREIYLGIEINLIIAAMTIVL
jgi:hypothetical protein